jgi:hypothetical protein
VRSEEDRTQDKGETGDFRHWTPVRGSSHCTSPSAQQVNDQNHHRYNQKQVDQGPADMQTEAEQPQNQKDNENRPKHVNPHLQRANN